MPKQAARKQTATAASEKAAGTRKAESRSAEDLGLASSRETMDCDAQSLGRFWSVQTVIFLCLWCWFMVDGRSRFFADPGAFWHPVVGRQILTTGQFPHTDQFSFTCAGKPWIASLWLGECGLALLDIMSEFDGILLGTATLLAYFYAWLAHRLIRAGIPAWGAILLVALALRASSYQFFARPHLATIVFLGWTFTRLCDFEAGRIPLRGLFWLVPLCAVWANIHGGVLGGIGTIVLAVSGWAVAKLVGLPSPLERYSQLAALSGLVACCGLATLLNPYGLELHRSWITVMESPVVRKHIGEHQPLVESPYVSLAGSVAVVYLATLASVRPSQIRVTWLLPLVWLCLAWTRMRHGPLFASVAILALAEVLPSVGWSDRLFQRGNDLLKLPSSVGQQKLGWRVALVPLAVVVSVATLQFTGSRLPVMGRGWATPDERFSPVDLLPELRTYERSHRAARPIFNDMQFSGFLIYHTPRLQVFIDDRCDLYGDDALLAYCRAVDEDPAQVNHWADEFGFDGALTVTGSRVDHALRRHGAWRVVRETKTATLHERRIILRP